MKTYEQYKTELEAKQTALGTQQVNVATVFSKFTTTINGVPTEFDANTKHCNEIIDVPWLQAITTFE